MRPMHEIALSIGGSHYLVSPKIVAEVEALLREARVKAVADESQAWVSAEALFPEMFDPVMGPAHYLKGMRARAGMTQAALAAALGMRQSHLSEMERGKRPIGKMAAKKFASVLQANWKSFLA